MPDLDDIRAFAEVADSGSLTRAGARLGMSKSMISRRLARLEAELGTTLLSRTTRGMSLTEAGGDFRPYAERIVADLEAARDALSRQGEATGRLRLSAPVSFGASHLAAVIAELAVRHPQLAISTSYSDRLADLVGEGFDAAVRLGNLADSSLIARADRAGACFPGGEPGLSRPRRDAAHARRSSPGTRRCRTATTSGSSSATDAASPTGRAGASPPTAGRRSSPAWSRGSGSR